MLALICFLCKIRLDPDEDHDCKAYLGAKLTALNAELESLEGQDMGDVDQGCNPAGFTYL